MKLCCLEKLVVLVGRHDVILFGKYSVTLFGEGGWCAIWKGWYYNTIWIVWCCAVWNGWFYAI